MRCHPTALVRHAVVPLFALALAAGLVLPEAASAARASKPKEIVVVGSKVKEVIRSAGFSTEGNVIAALGGRILDQLDAAMDRAERNGRYLLRPDDLDCPTRPDDGDTRMTKSEIISQIAKRSGFEVERGFLINLNAHANQLVAEAVLRAGSNKRGTVRPYDL